MLTFIVLGIVQGFTEFLPISSSGHLVILQKLFGITTETVFIDLVLHLGTLCAVVVFFRTDIFILLTNFLNALIDIMFRRKALYVMRHDDKFRLVLFIAVATLVTGCIGMMGKGFFQRQFESVTTVIVCLVITGVFLLSTRKIPYGQRALKHISVQDAIVTGFVQACAILPGFSRSGSTISTLILRNVNRESAFTYSFLISIPAIAGAFLIKFHEVQAIERSVSVFHLFVGFFTAFFSGLVALHILSRVLRAHRMYKFAYYCFALAALLFILKIRNQW